MRITGSVLRVVALLLVSSVCHAGRMDTVRRDLKPLIKSAVNIPVQFAVPVAHRVSAASAGLWSTAESPDRARWTYSIRIPTASSLSFHARQLRLPASAVLTVRGATTTVVYRAADLAKGDLWSRVQPGDTLEFTLDVATSERGKVVLDIQSFQAGFRALGAGALDHPYYRQLLGQSAAGSNGACVQNYACGVTAANTPPGQATVGLVIGNLYQCTGTLINDAPGDNAPYVLTARHCENGKYGGGTPAAADNVTVYWHATTPCGASLGSLYDPGAITQSGAATVVEQQDVWLIRLAQSPAVSDAQFAGFDARGVVVQGGYTIHHALGFNEQLTKWFGTAYHTQQSGVLGVSYLSQFLETVNQSGNIGPGASGSALIDGNNRIVGALSLGRKSADPSGYEACPSPSPAAPNGSNGTADFTSLAAVWNSTADTTSTTGTATLKSVLDPANSGVQTVAGTVAINLHFAVSSYSLSDGDALTVSWDAGGATQCTAGGGANSDGWSGTLPASGSRTLTETFGGSVSYSLICQFSGNRRTLSSQVVNWYGSGPFVNLSASGVEWINANAVLTWSSNVAPCSITGGGLSLSGLPSTGTTNTTQGTPGDVTYAISCGSSPSATSQTTVSYIVPTLEFRANSTDRLLGQPLTLYWLSYAESCIPSGGAPNDGWTTSAFSGANNFTPDVSAAGSYTYTLTCSAGPNQVIQSVTVTIENDAPYVTLSVDPATVTYSLDASDFFKVSWKSNLTNCVLNGSPVTPFPEYTTYPLLPQGASDAEDTGVYAPQLIQIHVLTMTCTSAIGTAQASVTSAPVTLTVLPPPPPTVTLSTSAATLTVGQQYTITWSSTNAPACAQTGNGASVGSAWGGGSGTQASGTQTDSVNHAGTATLGITCESIDPNQAPTSAQTVITVNDPPPPTASVSVSPASVTNGQTYTISWSSTQAAGCAAGGGGANGSTWSEAIATAGSRSQIASVNGSFTFTVTCTGNNQTAVARAGLSVSAAAGAGSSKGGGGSLRWVELLMLATLLGWRAVRSRLQ